MKRLFLVCLSLLLCMGCIAVLAAEEECTQHVAACTAPNVCVHCGHVEEGMGIGTGYCDYSIYHSYKDYHVLACSHCGMEKYEWTGALESEGHGRNCTENFCFTCGATDCNFIFVGHDPETFVTEDMGDTHGDKCGVCGGYEESSIMPHEAICTDPDVCRYCGHANPENVWHRNMSSTWTDLGTTHGKYCSDCQTYVDEEAHQASCAEPNKCIVCDLEVDTAELSHGSSAVVGDDTHHWVGCSLCKAPFDDKEAHFTYCSQDDQSICCGCGEAVDAANISFFHDFEDSSNWGYDDNVHWQNCWCGEVSNDYTETHERDCLMDACYCGYAGENITVNHFFDSAIGYEYDADSHWKTCTRCTDTEASKEGHKAACNAPNTCVYCRATNIDPKTLNHNGEVFWKNEGDTHTLVWSCCNITQVDSQPHVADCTADKTKCKVCEAEGVVTETVHSGELIWRNDGATHTQVRTCCSTAVGDSGEHRINCNAEDTSRCMTCGFVCEQIILNHNQQSKVWSDADTHWNGCFDCGKPFGDKISHYISCDSEDMSKCSGCGTTIDPANVNVAHNDLGLTEWEFDGEAHWRKECACGESMTWDTHWISCDALNAGCAVCGYAGSDMPVYHAFGGAVYIDGQYHEEACARCEHTQIEKHTSFSCQSNICELCGSSFDNTNPNHAWNYEAVQYDASGHWYSCIDCGEEMKSGHWYTCSDPDTCATCGYVSPTATKYDHYWTEVYQTDNPDYHYKKCDGCGDEYAIASHTVSCSNPGVCTGCGATNITVDEIKHGNVSWEYNATKHWGVCGTCGETQKEGPHWTDCSKPNLCQDCGATGVNIDPGILSHFNVDWNNREHDATHHWYTCRSCGSKAFYGQHYIKCSTEGVCFECGVTGDFTIEHEALKAGWLSDENNHWKICAVCDNVANKADHADTNNDEKCDTCNKKLPHKHSWGEPVTKPATCTADGSITTTCGSCGESTVETIKSDGHSWGEPVTKPATCTADGSITTTCGSCGESTVETIKSDGHAWGEPVTKPATCTADGSITTTCGSCGESTVETIKSDGHSWGEPVTKPATCTADGSITTTCSSCGESTVETIKSDGHAWGKPVTKPATCTADGSITTTCGSCGESTVETIKSDGHSWGEPVTKPATCTADGSITTTCGSCGESTVETIKSDGHAWGEPLTVVATCTADGSKTIACANCDEKNVETIKATGHTWGEPVIVAATCTADGSKTTTCANCGESTVSVIASLGGHNWKTTMNKAATCTDKGRVEKRCSVCNTYTVSTSAAKGHSWGAPVIIEPSCTAEGSKTIACANCNEKTVETIKSEGHAWGDPVTIPVTCTADGSITTICVNCGESTVETIKSEGHAWGDPVTIPATCTADGSITTICANCGEKTEETIISTGHAYSLVYTTQGNGMHARSCSVCGSVQTAKCNMTTTNMGSMSCSACAICGYTVYTFNEVAAEKPAEPEKTETTQGAAEPNAEASVEKAEETAPVVTEAKAETVVKRVENVSFELVAPIVEETKESAADENVAAETVEPDASTETAEEAEKPETEPEAPTDHSEVVLVVHETKVEMKVELPDTVTAEVKKVLAVSMLKEGNAIQPAATVKLSIPVVEEEVTGLKLMLMTDSGELVEVEYEIVDGVIVFATDVVGVFLFVDAEA